MANCVLIFGPQASGKMTVGQELAKITELKLFHNHMTIDLLEPFFGFTPEMWRLANLFRFEIFEAAAKSNMEGLIFTFVWAFNQQKDWEYVDRICEIFESNGGSVYLIELETELEVRLERNKSPNRLAHKPTKRNVEYSEAELKSSMKKHRLNSREGEIQRKNYVKLNNTHISAEEAAAWIKNQFSL
jgi:hypothetical protein